jgi:solute carrier family 35, member E1
MLACTFDISASNTAGLLSAFASAIVFVSSNIFYKKIMPSAGSGGSQSSHKMDKVNLLFYSSGMAFVLMIPIWMYTDLPSFLSSPPAHIAVPTAPRITTVLPSFLLNGFVHFLQNITAFVLLSCCSPVTYSIASLIKRVAVICFAIFWFAQPVHPVQALGIAMTFWGLWMYNQAKRDGDVDRGERKRDRVERGRMGWLPTTRADVGVMSAETTGTVPSSNAYTRPKGVATVSPHPPPHLHIEVHQPSPTPYYASKRADDDAPPIASYPSPPPSLDSPPG